MIEILRILIALFGTGIAAYYDMYNKKNVPDVLLFGFLAVALMINLVDPTYFMKYIVVAGLITAVFYLMYRIGQLGGADVIVLAAIYAALPVFPLSEEAMFPSILVVVSIATVLASVWILFRYLPELLKKTFKGKVRFSLAQLIQVVVLLFALAMMLYLFISFPYISPWIMVLVLLLFVEAIFFILYKDEISKSMVVWKKKVEQEDVIAIELVKMELVKKYKLSRLVSAKQAKAMNKLKNKWPVLDMPMFLPFILIGLIMYLLMGFV